MSISRMILAVSVVVSIVACGSGTPTNHTEVPESDGNMVSESVSAEVLDSQFRSGDEAAIRSAIQKSTRIWSGTPDMKVYGLLLDVWNQKEDLHPNYNWQLLRNPKVRIVLASELVQSYRNGRIPLTTGEFRDFALDHINNSPRELSGPAVVLLGQVGEAGDIDLLEKLAMAESGGLAYFHESILALNHICGKEAQLAIERLRDKAEGEKRKFAQGALDSREQFLMAVCH